MRKLVFLTKNGFNPISFKANMADSITVQTLENLDQILVDCRNLDLIIDWLIEAKIYFDSKGYKQNV